MINTIELVTLDKVWASQLPAILVSMLMTTIFLVSSVRLPSSRCTLLVEAQLHLFKYFRSVAHNKFGRSLSCLQKFDGFFVILPFNRLQTETKPKKDKQFN